MAVTERGREAPPPPPPVQVVAPFQQVGPQADESCCELPSTCPESDQLSGDTLRIRVERCSSSSKDADAAPLFTSKGHHYLLSPTGTARRVAVLHCMQVLTVGVAEGP